MGAETISEPVYNLLNAAIVRARGLVPEKIAELPIVQILWRRRQIIGCAVLGAFVLACIYLLLAKPSYTSTAELYIVESQGPAMGSSNDYLNTQCILLTSTPVLALALAEDGIKDLETLSGQINPIEYLRQNVRAEVAKHTDLIDVSLEAHNKTDAAKLVSAVVQAYITYQTRIQHSNSAEVLALLEKQKTHDEDVISAKNQQLAAFGELYGQPADDSAQNNSNAQQESTLSSALSAARLDTANAKSAYDQALVMVGDDSALMARIVSPADPADLVAPSPDQLLQIRTEIVQYEQAIQDMERTYLPDHPRVLSARSHLNDLIVSDIRADRQRWLSAQAQEQALQASFDQLHQRVLEQAARAADFNRLSTEVSRAEKDLDVVQTRIGEVSVNQDAGNLNIEVIQTAAPALDPSHPAKLRTLAGWLFAGLAVGCGLAVGLEKLPLGPRPMSELALELGAPVIGILPFTKGAMNLADRALQTHFEPAGPVAQTSRSIVRIITESGLDEAGGRSLLIASMNPLEGRTTLATNLAVAMAQSGKKVLLIDANHRSPRLHQIFNLNNHIGLFDLLHGRTFKHRVAQRTMVENVDVLTAGVLTGNSVELLNTELLVDVLGEFSDQYDRVIVDAPELGRGVESRILAANCTAAILVTAARPTARRQVGHALGMLRSVGAHVLGLVINEPGSVDSPEPAKTNSSTVRDPSSADETRTFHSALASGTED